MYIDLCGLLLEVRTECPSIGVGGGEVGRGWAGPQFF